MEVSRKEKISCFEQDFTITKEYLGKDAKFGVFMYIYLRSI